MGFHFPFSPPTPVPGFPVAKQGAELMCLSVCGGPGCLWILQEGLQAGPLPVVPYQVFFFEGNVHGKEDLGGHKVL